MHEDIRRLLGEINALETELREKLQQQQEQLRYRIETEVERGMHGMRFDVAYADEMREPWRSRALAGLRHESDLR